MVVLTIELKEEISIVKADIQADIRLHLISHTVIHKHSLIAFRSLELGLENYT